ASRLTAQLLGRARALLAARRRLLGHAVHLFDGGVDLADSDVLLLARGGDLGHHLADAVNLLIDFLEVAQHLAVQPDARLGVGDAVLDQRGRVLRRLGAAHREVAHLLRDDGEAPTRLARPRGLDRRVQGEQVRLERDLIDRPHDLRGRVRAGLDLLHRQRQSPHALDAAPGDGARLLRQLLRLLRVRRVLARHGAQLLERAPHLLEAARLLGGGRRERAAAAVDLVARRRDLLGARADLGQRIVEVRDRRVERFLDPREVALVLALHAGGEVALRDTRQDAGRLVDRADHRVQRVVDPVDELAVRAVEVARVGALGQAAGPRGGDEFAHVRDQARQRIAHLDERLAEDVRIAARADHDVDVA